MAELERFAVMLSRPRAFEHFGNSSFPQICETVHTLILVRMSQESNVQASKESRLALIISCIALLAGLVQTVLSIWQLFTPSATLVYASSAIPARAIEAIPVYAVSNVQVLQKPSKNNCYG